MIFFPSRHGAFPLLSVAGCGLGLLFCGSQAAFLPSAAAQTPVVSPAQPASQSPERVAGVGTPQTDSKGRHLAPHDTFYVLSYVSVTTDTGVEGFVPGEEVHLVSVNRPAHTLMVSDGKAQVEVPPGKLTNDLDIAALARQKEQANQTQLAAYAQAEEAAYVKYEQAQADQSAKIDENRKEQAQADRAQVAARDQGETGAQPVDASLGGAGYYGSGGYGYGSPYSYFSGSGVVISGPNRAPGASGPGGGKDTIPSDRAGTSTRSNTAPTAVGGATGAGGGAHAGGGGGGGKP